MFHTRKGVEYSKGNLSNHDEKDNVDVKESRRVWNEDGVSGEKMKLKQLLKEDDV